MSEKRLIESPSFPVDVVNEASAKEKGGGGRPPHWEMVFWWTRKPLAGARAVVLASLLPEDSSVSEFLKWIYPSLELYRGVFKVRKGRKEIELPVAVIEGERYGVYFDGSPHGDSPELPSELKEKLKDMKLLDLFAGFGSIPLEAIRLGVGEAVAVELLPTAYIFLKAVLEHPKWAADRGLGEKLVEDVEKWGRWVAEQLRRDPDIKELYDEDVAVYIGTWEVKCPVCNRYTPLVGNWWLARVKGKKYAYMRPVVKDGRVEVEVVEGKTGGAPEPNVRGRPEKAKCLLCGSAITFYDPETGRVYSSRKDAKGGEVRERLVFYPKHALRDWNKRLEEYLDGGIGIDGLRSALARPRILVKVKVVNKDLVFEPATQEDTERLWKALEKLKQMWGDPDIPTELLPHYDQEFARTHLWGFDKFYKLFNPRQLLALVKLVKLIREAGKRVEEEKLREGWSREDAHKYAEAVTTYLAIALCKHADFNSAVSHWTITWLIPNEALAMRGIAMVWNYGEYSPYVSNMTGTWSRNIVKVLESLEYLINAVSGSPSRVRVLLDDATTLSRLGDEKFDLIVTDPPYRDDVPYAELSDFYYVWLKRALSDDGLAPRFHGEALVYRTQWEAFAASEISYNEGRLKYFNVKEPEDYYERLMSMAFRRMEEVLKDNGLIVTYFAHSSPEAWRELIEAGWRRNGLRVTKAWAVATESEERVTARGKTALESSIVIVWRKRDGSKVGDYMKVYGEAVKSATEARKEAVTSGLTGADAFLATMIGALSVFTSYDKVVRFGKELSTEDIVRESYAIATRVVAGATDAIKSPEALLYLAAKAVYGHRDRKTPIVLSSQDIIVLSYGLVKEAGEKGYKLFEEAGIVKVAKTSGSEVAKQKAYELVEPLGDSIEEVKRVLGESGVDPIKLGANGRELNTIDVLHLLEYYALQGIGEFRKVYQELYSKHPDMVREAVEVARVLSTFAGDPENKLVSRVKSYVEAR